MSRRLNPLEKALWDRVSATVTPMVARPRHKETAPPAMLDAPAVPPPPPKRAATRGRVPPPPAPPPVVRERPRPLDGRTLDGSWDRSLASGRMAPDFTLDLHGCTLDSAHSRLDHGLTLALSQGARVVLLITGRPRPSDDHASRGERRGAIRAKFLDWLAFGPHASRIAAIRPAHPRHGGAGAVYVVLKRPR